jgi:uncharacterized protein with PIN domain
MSHPLTIYADVSVKDQVAVAAWFVDTDNFGAIRLENQSSSFAETRAAAYVLSQVPLDHDGPITLVTDNMALVNVLRTERAAVRSKDPHVLDLFRATQQRSVLVEHRYGHGKRTPAPLKFCDILSRALTRRAQQLDLAVGDAFIAATPGKFTHEKHTRLLPVVPKNGNLFVHVQVAIRLAIGDAPHLFKHPDGIFRPRPFIGPLITVVHAPRSSVLA